MLTGISIADYQSHRRTRIPLGLFTVVVGPTGSGKSAVIRAAQLAARNAKGADYVRRGSARAVVALTDTDPATGESVTVAIRRGARGTAGDLYRVRGPGGQRDYTKLGGQVPGDVAALLRMGDLNFAGQLDPPFLLGASGSDIARTLGELTNVAMVFRAAGEAGKVRKRLERDARAAAARVEDLRSQAKAYEGLADRRAAAARAAGLAAGLEERARQAARLRQLATRLEAAQAEAAQAEAAARAAAPPDLARLERGLAALRRLQSLLSAHGDAGEEVEFWAQEAECAAEREEQARQAVHDALRAAGQCPVCGQEVAA